MSGCKMKPVKTQRAVRTCGAAASTTAAVAMSMLLLLGEASSSAMPMSFAGGDIVATLKECGDSPVRTVSCVGAQGSGKSTLMRSMLGEGRLPRASLCWRRGAARRTCPRRTSSKWARGSRWSLWPSRMPRFTTCLCTISAGPTLSRRFRCDGITCVGAPSGYCLGRAKHSHLWAQQPLRTRIRTADCIALQQQR